MNKYYIIIFFSIFLTSCQNNLLTNIAKSDIDIVTEIHVNNAKENEERRIRKNR